MNEFIERHYLYFGSALLVVVGIRLWFQYTRRTLPPWLNWTTYGLLAIITAALAINLFSTPLRFVPLSWSAWPFIPITILFVWWAWRMTHKMR